MIDLVKARLDARNDCFLVELPALQLRDVRINDELVHTHERMLTEGFYAEVTLSYDAAIAEEKMAAHSPLIVYAPSSSRKRMCCRS